MRVILSPLINTPLQRGVRTTNERLNRYSGLSRARETVETVALAPTPLITPLKRGVNERLASLPLGLAVLTNTATLKTL
jgi:hypothetical protein